MHDISNFKKKKKNWFQVRGREIPPEVETVRGTWVWRLTCASIFILCLRTSSSLSLTEHTSDRKASGEGGREDSGGWRNIARAASSLVHSRIAKRQQVTMARATRRRNGIPKDKTLNNEELTKSNATLPSKRNRSQILFRCSGGSVPTKRLENLNRQPRSVTV